MQTAFDMVLIGDGCASWMLLEALSRREGFQRLNILLLGAGEVMDRSWCFWDDDLPAPYHGMVERSWERMTFTSGSFTTSQSLGARRYHYLPGEAFFRYFKETFLPLHPQIQYRVEPVTGISGRPGAFSVHTTLGNYRAAQVYNSGYMAQPPEVGLWQHFRGWFIALPAPLPRPDHALLMDFNVPQERGCSFMYVLPLSDRTALVEYTYFSEEVYEPAVYEEQLHAYIAKHYGTQYDILRRESGRIPMQQGVFAPVGPCGEIQTGTLGGMVKASTGYAFRRIRHDSKALAAAYFSGSTPRRACEFTRFTWYDTLMLWIIRRQPQTCKGIFARFFQRQNMQLISRFMDEETAIGEELRIFASLPKGIFLKALWYSYAAPKR